MKKWLIIIAFLIGVPAFLIAVMAYQGWALAVLWSWFIVPLGAPKIGVVHAAGLALVYNFFSRDIVELANKENHDDIGTAVVKIVGVPLLFLLIGGLIVLCM